MKRVFGIVFCITFVLSIVWFFVLIWQFSFFNLKLLASFILATILFYHFDEVIIKKYGQ